MNTGESSGNVPENLLGGFFAEVKNLKTTQSDQFHQTLTALGICRRYLEDHCGEILRNGFRSQEDEIVFFKKVRPTILGNWLYFSQKYQLLIRRPIGSQSMWEQFIHDETAVAAHYFSANAALYHYFRSQSTHFDTHYFVRQNAHKLNETQTDIIIDKSNTTGYDLVFAKFISNEMIIQLLQEWRTNPATAGQNETVPQVRKLEWTDSKALLTEFAYACKFTGVFNNGKASMQNIIEYFEYIFSVNLGNHSRTFQEILARKMGYATGLNRLTKSYLDNIEIIQERHRPKK
ncbi:RteC domain-containing protein [Paraflavitalea sp. CAU 1676]|uniref:RteC domain-containing protein n=1 Tax=Paraflavitalea sp. CAU 1676 TaxID=3032598 RepID=UPI0023DC1B40|nr:RteC domain-containing protein [Paraflavitalea sp. CAU 1676]MDF2190515.1 RteC domain-containing protein [Paraflavitalea sp. CAU 1676]